jgi:steroid delta-isomerase-like uncharacterized protein
MSRFEDLSKKYVDAVNRHDIDGVAALYAEDCVVYSPVTPEPLRGRAAVRKDFADFDRGFPDLRFEIRTQFEKGDVGASELHVTGTNTRPLVFPGIGEIPATNKRTETWGVAIARINSAGLIVEERRYFDSSQLMRQLGLAPEPAMAGAAR